MPEIVYAVFSFFKLVTLFLFFVLFLCSGFKQWKVFFHFVGATPGSTDLAFFLQRLTKEVKPDMKDIASDLETLIQLRY